VEADAVEEVLHRKQGPDVGGDGEGVTDCWRAGGGEELAAAGGGIGSGRRSEVA
jgi:hypothetical protein